MPGVAATAGSVLATSGLAHAEARALLANVLQVAREYLIAHPEAPVAEDEAAQFAALAGRRGRGEPMAYLLGRQEFYGRTFVVTPDVLIPRPDTETLVDAALDCLRDTHAPRVLELGTGSGCVAITLQLARRDARVTATDLSTAALAIARTNARALDAPVELREGHWFDAVATGEAFHLIVSNPPYVARSDPHLPALAHEPTLALSDGADGLRCLSAIIDGAAEHLSDAGWLALEHGYDQAATVGRMLRSAGFRSIAVYRDAGGHERVTRARR
jgi:release factor glutamine methyltransferase